MTSLSSFKIHYLIVFHNFRLDDLDVVFLELATHVVERVGAVYDEDAIDQKKVRSEWEDDYCSFKPPNSKLTVLLKASCMSKGGLNPDFCIFSEEKIVCAQNFFTRMELIG